MNKKIIVARILVALDFPVQMGDDVESVLKGEYESKYFGENLDILDIGANVGAFSLWANLRWPYSRIYAFEPHPETFGILTNNIKGLNNITCYNVAVYPTDNKLEPFWGRYAGDGEAGLVAYMGETFKDLPKTQILQVPVIHPRELPKADIVKLDVEGAEALIIENMDFKEVSLFLLEYQNIKNRNIIKDLLINDFHLEYEDEYKWDPLLPNSNYRNDLKGNYYGRLFFVNKRRNRLKKLNYKCVAGFWGMTLKEIFLELPSPLIGILKRMKRVLRHV